MIDLGDCMMFTNELVLCQYCKPIFEALYSHKTLAFIGVSGWRTEQINNLLRVFSRAAFGSHCGRA